MNHQFDTEIAKEYGVNIAIMLSNLNFWILKNKANNKHFYDGKYWTYNSVKAFQELFPYWSNKQIRTILDKMIDYGLIEKGNYNISNYDKTCWYTITDLGNSILQNGEIDLPKKANRIDQKGEPIPDINTYIKPDNNISEEVKNTVTQIILYLNEKANKNYKVEAKCHRVPIQARLKDGYTIKDFKKVIDVKVGDWLNTDMNEYLVPETLFRPTNMEKYLNKANKKKEYEVEVTW